MQARKCTLSKTVLVTWAFTVQPYSPFKNEVDFLSPNIWENSCIFWASLVTQKVKNLPAMQETRG